MNIRYATLDDLNEILEIYNLARKFMRENGNPTQWPETYPNLDDLKNGIADGYHYVCTQDDEIIATFFYKVGVDETYNKIYNGQWINDDEYGVIHKIASRAKGAGAFCINFAVNDCKNLKIDTHEVNKPMRNLLEKLGFTYCGIVLVEKDEERVAYQKSI